MRRRCRRGRCCLILQHHRCRVRARRQVIKAAAEAIVWSMFHSYPITEPGADSVLPAGRDATPGVAPSAIGCRRRAPQRTIIQPVHRTKILPLSAFSRPPSPGGLNRGSRQVVRWVGPRDRDPVVVWVSCTRPACGGGATCIDAVFVASFQKTWLPLKRRD